MRRDRKLRSRTFSISEGHMLLIEAYADTYDLSSSQAVRRLLEVAEQHIDSEVRMDVAQRRAQLARKVRDERPPEAQKMTFPDKCPNCGDTNNIVTFPSGKWECNVCMFTGVVG